MSTANKILSRLERDEAALVERAGRACERRDEVKAGRENVEVTSQPEAWWLCRRCGTSTGLIDIGFHCDQHCQDTGEHSLPTALWGRDWMLLAFLADPSLVVKHKVDPCPDCKPGITVLFCRRCGIGSGKPVDA